jgi:hypothetical protein
MPAAPFSRLVATSSLSASALSLLQVHMAKPWLRGRLAVTRRGRLRGAGDRCADTTGSSDCDGGWCQAGAQVGGLLALHCCRPAHLLHFAVTAVLCTSEFQPRPSERRAAGPQAASMAVCCLPSGLPGAAG